MPLYKNDLNATLNLGRVGKTRKIYSVPGKGKISTRGLPLDVVNILDTDLKNPAIVTALKEKWIVPWDGLNAGDVKAAGQAAIDAKTTKPKDLPVPDLSKGIAGGKSDPVAKAAKTNVAKAATAKAATSKVADKGGNGPTASQ